MFSPDCQLKRLPCKATELVGLAAGLISTSKWPPDLCVSLYSSVSKRTCVIFFLFLNRPLLFSFFSRISECEVSVTAVGGVVEQLPRPSQSFLSVLRLNLWQHQVDSVCFPTYWRKLISSFAPVWLISL